MLSLSFIAGGVLGFVIGNPTARTTMWAWATAAGMAGAAQFGQVISDWWSTL